MVLPFTPFQRKESKESQSEVVLALALILLEWMLLPSVVLCGDAFTSSPFRMVLIHPLSSFGLCCLASSSWWLLSSSPSCVWCCFLPLPCGRVDGPFTLPLCGGNQFGCQNNRFSARVKFQQRTKNNRKKNAKKKKKKKRKNT